MSKTAKYTYKPGQYRVDPNTVNLVTEDKFDPLYNERALEKPSPEFVQELKTEGWHGVVQVVERAHFDVDDQFTHSTLDIVAGRRRVINSIEAGLAEIEVEVLNPDSTNEQLIGWMLSENEHRKEDNAVNKARVIERYIESYVDQYRPATTTQNEETGEIEYGGEAWRPTPKQYSEAKKAAALKAGCSVRRVEQLLELLKAPKPIIKAIQSNKITASDADNAGLLRMSEGAALAKLERMVEKSGGGKVGRGVATSGSSRRNATNKATGKANGKNKTGLTPNEIHTLLTELVDGEASIPEQFKEFCLVLLGRKTADKTGLKWFQKALGAMYVEVETEVEG